MFETLTIDVTNVKKILKCCPYYDDIINSDIMYNDDLSIDLIEWYKDIIFSCNGDNEEDIKKFHAFASVCLKKRLAIIEENNKLINLRDLLLPKLINGEINLDKIEV